MHAGEYPTADTSKCSAGQGVFVGSFLNEDTSEGGRDRRPLYGNHAVSEAFDGGSWEQQHTQECEIHVLCVILAVREELLALMKCMPSPVCTDIASHLESSLLACHLSIISLHALRCLMHASQLHPL
jgi:hypothetical protein